MGMGFAPTWLRQVSPPPASHDHFNHCRTPISHPNVRVTCLKAVYLSLHFSSHYSRWNWVSWFLPRDAMRKRGLCCGPVSVCLSVTLVHCIHVAEDIVKLLCGPGSTIILVFWPPLPVLNSKGNPFSMDAKYTGVGKFLPFSTKTAVYLRNGTMQANGCYGTLIGSHMRSIKWWHFQWPWRTPNPVFKVTALLKLNISKYTGVGQSYCRSLIGNHTQSIEWYHFQWPWLTFDQDFKVTIFFDIGYLRNDTR